MNAWLNLVENTETTTHTPTPHALFGAQVAYHQDGAGAVISVLAEDLPAHRQRFGPRPRMTGAGGSQMIDTLQAINLTGRGGGHFPAAVKWRAHLSAGGGGYVVANGSESEPASGKDAALLRLRPHLVLDGLACAAETVGAGEAILWLHQGAHEAHAAVTRALIERRHAGVSEPDMRIVAGPDRYLSGESSAILRSLSGGPALPEFRRAPATQTGINGQPTLVHNVETLARAGLAARTGVSGHQPSTLLTIAWDNAKTVLEVDPHTRLCDVIQRITARSGNGVPRAVLVGGYGGMWVDWASIAGLPADQTILREHNISLGAGILAPLPRDACGLVPTAKIAAYLAGSSARQCGPCLFGLRSVSGLLAELADGAARRRDTTRLQRFLGEIRGRGGCNHPDGAVRMISSATSTFAQDIDSHLRHGRCLHSGADGFFPVPEVS